MTDHHDLIVAHDRGGRVDLAVAAWLSQAKRRSHRTWTAYKDTLAGFRAYLHAHGGYDLDAAQLVLQLHLQEYAGAAMSRHGGPAAPSTYNHRIACVSAFYRYTVNHALLSYPANPVTGMERRRIQKYAGAQPLDKDAVARALASIDRSTISGARDYALLRVGLSTGRRVSELADMSIGHLEMRANGTILVTFPHAKGERLMRDELSPAVSACVLAWLARGYPAPATPAAGSPGWYSLSWRRRGARLATESIGEVCRQRLGVTKVHALRHTFAVEMERAGASVSEIQSRLGHSSIATTGTYLAQLGSAQNRWAGALDAAFAPGG